MNKFIVIGPPGSGKSTQARLLAQACDAVHISIGEILRWNIAHHTKLGSEIERCTEAGLHVEDSIVETLVKERLEEHDWNHGFVLDGYPRNKAQAEFFLSCWDIDALIWLKVPDILLTERLMNSRNCPKCEVEYNLLLQTTNEPETCDVCGGKLATHPYDRPDVVKVRLLEYHSKIAPAIETFRRKELVIATEGTPLPMEIHAKLLRELGMTSRAMMALATSA